MPLVQQPVFQGSDYSECSMSNPLRCEMGDQSSKVGQYDIGGGKQFYTDVNLNLEAQFSGRVSSDQVVIIGDGD